MTPCINIILHVSQKQNRDRGRTFILALANIRLVPPSHLPINEMIRSQLCKKDRKLFMKLPFITHFVHYIICFLSLFLPPYDACPPVGRGEGEDGRRLRGPLARRGVNVLDLASHLNPPPPWGEELIFSLNWSKNLLWDELNIRTSE